MLRFKQAPAEPYRISPEDVTRVLEKRPKRCRNQAAPYWTEPDVYEGYKLKGGAVLIVYRKRGRCGVIFPYGMAWVVFEDPEKYPLEPLEFGVANENMAADESAEEPEVP